MKIWLLSQEQNTGWDTYLSAVVAATDEISASRIHPNLCARWDEEWQRWIWNWEREEKESFHSFDWANDPSSVDVEYLGEAKEGTKSGVILSKFNAG